MAFHDVRLPVEISYGSVGGPGFKTSVITAGAGREQRNQEWQRSRARYDLKYGIQNEEQMAQVIKFFYARRAMAFGFRFKDWLDYKIENQNIATLNGTAGSRYPVFKRYADESGTYDREITKLVPDSDINVRLDGGSPLSKGVHYNFDWDTGELIWLQAGNTGGIVSVEKLEFDVPVRFDIDDLAVSLDAFDQQSISSIPVVEIHPDEEIVTTLT